MNPFANPFASSQPAGGPDEGGSQVAFGTSIGISPLGTTNSANTDSTDHSKGSNLGSGIGAMNSGGSTLNSKSSTFGGDDAAIPTFGGTKFTFGMDGTTSSIFSGSSGRGGGPGGGKRRSNPSNAAPNRRSSSKKDSSQIGSVHPLRPFVSGCCNPSRSPW